MSSPHLRSIPVVWVAAAVAIALLGIWPALRGLSTLWLDSDRPGYTHGYLVAGMCCWVLWMRRPRIAAALVKSDSRASRVCGAACLLVCVMAWQISYRAGIQIIYLMLLPPLVMAALWAAFGRAVARACAFPLALLYFAMPWWDYINALPQWGTVFAVRLMMMVTGIPVRFSANIVEIPDGAFEVQGGCSGLHFIIVALTLAAFTGELRGDNLRGRLRLMWLALGLAVLTNWVRVFTIILAGHFTHMQSYLVRVSHYGYGWALFAVALAAFFAIERRLPVRPPTFSGSLTDEEQPNSTAMRQALPWGACAVAVLMLPTALNALIDARTAVEPMSTARMGAGWRSTASTLTGWHPVQRLADAELRQQWQRDDMQVDRFQATYLSQGERKKLGGAENRLEGNGEILETGVETGPAGSFRSADLVVDGAQSVLWYQYTVGDRRFTNATRAQLWYSVASLLSLRSVPSQLLAVRAECRPDCATARRTLRAFVGSDDQA